MASYHPSPETLKTIKENFNKFDINKDGSITTTELGTVMRSLGQNPTQEGLKKMVEQLDTDKSGKIEFIEFQKMMVGQLSGKARDAEFRAAFKNFDTDGSGYISLSEMRQVMTDIQTPTNVTDKEVENMIRDADLDKDGRINYEEFLKAMSGK